VLDGWWVEGCAEDVTGWAIDDADDEDGEASSLYDKLENKIAPLYARPNGLGPRPAALHRINGTFFNTHRMLGPVLLQRLLPADVDEQAVPVAVDLEAKERRPSIKESALV